MKPMETYTVLREALTFQQRTVQQQASSLILPHWHRSAYGYFVRTASAQNGSKTTVHEIALNPSHIRERKPKDTSVRWCMKWCTSSAGARQATKNSTITSSGQR